MKIRIIIPYAFCLIVTLFITGENVFAQEVTNDFETRTAVDLSFKPIKKLKLSLIPELRFDENFSLDEYLFEGEAEYKALNFLSFGAAYRFEVNPRDTKSTEYFHRYSFNTELEKELNRFETSFRLRYSNYADDEITDKSFLRYRAKLEYDIPKSKITPAVAVEAFHDLNENNLFKMRYTAGIDYKLFKNNYLGVDYKLDYYNNEYKNKHIISVGYKIKF